MIGQRALVVLALVAGALAGTLYYVGAQRSPVVVASRDVDATHPLVADDLAVVSIPADAVPAGALIDANTAVGKMPRAPLWRGQIVLGPALSEDAASFHTGLALPVGMRAVALPVSSAAQAVGGSIVPGARVDVIAVPVAGRAPGGRTTELLLQGALVLDVRSETGFPYGTAISKSATSSVSERIGSVVVAIDALDEVRFADRIATSMFVLTLAGSR
ncbi:MAG: Flp pilus assembly protein CpaB [Chloroflexota bacterium]|nr:Flp pilus assembly protein CpaB [Chloroflexota bacterium]